MEREINYHRNGYLLSNGDYKKILDCGDMVKIYYDDGGETSTSYIGYIDLPDDGNFKKIPLYNVSLPATECCYINNKWVSIQDYMYSVHRYKHSIDSDHNSNGWISIEYEHEDYISIPILDCSGLDLTKKPRYSYNGLEISIYQYGNLLDSLVKLDKQNLIDHDTNIYLESGSKGDLYDSSYNYIGGYKYEFYKIKNSNNYELDCKIYIEYNYETGIDYRNQLEEINDNKYYYYMGEEKPIEKDNSPFGGGLLGSLLSIKNKEDAKNYVDNAMKDMSQEEILDLAKIYYGIK